MQGFKRGVAVTMAAVLAMLVPIQALASATVNTYAVSCARLTASGTTTAPFVVLYVYDNQTGQTLALTSFPAGGGFSHTVTFTAQAEGTPFNVQVWGSPTSDPNDWDQEDYFNLNTACTGEAAAIPTLSIWATGALTLLLAGAFAVINSRRLRARPTRG